MLPPQPLEAGCYKLWHRRAIVFLFRHANGEVVLFQMMFVNASRRLYLFRVDELNVQVPANLHADIVLRDRSLGCDSNCPLSHINLLDRARDNGGQAEDESSFPRVAGRADNLLSIPVLHSAWPSLRNNHPFARVNDDPIPL